MNYQCLTYHPFTAGDQLLLSKYSVGLCCRLCKSHPCCCLTVFLQACGGDTPGLQGQGERESTHLSAERDRGRERGSYLRDSFCGSAPRQQSNTVNMLSAITLETKPPQDAERSTEDLIMCSKVYVDVN